jgi:hypothetical protein
MSTLAKTIDWDVNSHQITLKRRNHVQQHITLIQDGMKIAKTWHTRIPTISSVVIRETLIRI